MQERELNRATIGVVNRTDIRGRGTADEMNRGLLTGKQRSFWCIASLTFLGSSMVAGLLVALAPLPARADNDKDSRHGHEDNDKGIRAEIAALHAQVDSLQTTVSALQDQVNSLQTSNTTLQNQLANAKNVVALDPFVSVDPNPQIGVAGPNITFTGANIHIVSGSGRTDDNLLNGGSLTGLGNLIIGYDEDPGNFADTSPFDNLPLSPLIAGDRGGSHNLVIGAANRFTQTAFGGLVVGTANAIKGPGASVSGGAGNSAVFYGASVSGGFSNTAGHFFSSVSGGRLNTASSPSSSVSGGTGNSTPSFIGQFFGSGASVSGGTGNRASGTDASVCGGENNNAIDIDSTVTGGSGNTAGSQVTFQGGIGASVSGGTGNNAGGRNTAVIGGQNVTDNKDNSIAPQPPFP